MDGFMSDRGSPEERLPAVFLFPFEDEVQDTSPGYDRSPAHHTTVTGLSRKGRTNLAPGWPDPQPRAHATKYLFKSPPSKIKKKARKNPAPSSRIFNFRISPQNPKKCINQN